MSAVAGADGNRVLVVSTGNVGKTKEIEEALADLSYRVRMLRDVVQDAPEVVEDGDTFLANARKKAVAGYLVTGLPTLADDSGLEVEALAMEPGVHSARYAGPDATDADNNRRLLQSLAEVPQEERGAQFRSVIVVIDSRGNEIVVEGTCKGTLLTSPRGEGGFGYDPLFLPEGHGRTFAEMASTEKNVISHRGLALANLVRILEQQDLY